MRDVEGREVKLFSEIPPATPFIRTLDDFPPEFVKLKPDENCPYNAVRLRDGALCLIFGHEWVTPGTITFTPEPICPDQTLSPPASPPGPTTS